MSLNPVGDLDLNNCVIKLQEAFEKPYSADEKKVIQEYIIKNWSSLLFRADYLALQKAHPDYVTYINLEVYARYRD